MTTQTKREVAYILKGYPRLSETFIINEIYLLEQMGMALRLFVLKTPEEKKSHAIVDKIRAAVTYLPETASITESQPTFAQITLSSYKYAALVQASTEVLEDSGVNIEAYLARRCGEAVGRQLGAALVTGTGSSPL